MFDLIEPTFLCLSETGSNINHLSVDCYWSDVYGYRAKSARMKTAYKRDYVNMEGDVDLVMTGPVFKGSTVFM